MQGLIDTHCHLDMLKAEIPEILSSAKEAGVEKVITISVDEESQKRVLELSRNWPNVFGTLGVHPHSASEYHPGISDQIRNAFSEQKLRIRMKVQNYWQSENQGWIIITSTRPKKHK